MRKSVSITIVICSVFSLLLISVQVSFYVNAQPPVTFPEITISSDGSIQSSLSPSPIINEGNMYIINENISGYGIDIQRSNIVLLGEGNTLQATAEYNTNSGITIEANGVTVENVSIVRFAVGVDAKGSSNKVTGCNITAGGNGVNVGGQANLITENNISNCAGNGIELTNSANNVTYNTINCPVMVDKRSNSNVISGNLLVSTTFDIMMYGNNNVVVSNTITGGSLGVIFYDPANANIVTKNDIVNNYEGIGLNKQANSFYLNNFINNTYNVRLHFFGDPYAPYSMNVFDNGSVGNYWSDYTTKYPNAKETGNTGIYNIPYVIDGNITDNYPLTTSYTVGNTGAQISTQSSSNPTPTPAVPEFSWLAILPLLLLFSIAVLFRHRKDH
jgi:hypothetical protein